MNVHLFQFLYEKGGLLRSLPHSMCLERTHPKLFTLELAERGCGGEVGNFAVLILSDDWWGHLRSLGTIIVWYQKGWKSQAHFWFFCIVPVHHRNLSGKEIHGTYGRNLCLEISLAIDREACPGESTSGVWTVAWQSLHSTGCLRRAYFMYVGTSGRSPQQYTGHSKIHHGKHLRHSYWLYYLMNLLWNGWSIPYLGCYIASGMLLNHSLCHFSLYTNLCSWQLAIHIHSNIIDKDM